MTVFIGTKLPGEVQPITGLDFAGNQPGPLYQDYIIWNATASGTTIPPMVPLTVIIKSYPKAAQDSYYSHFFWANRWAEVSFDGGYDYGGAHPYKDPAGILNPGPEAWEIAANALDIFLHEDESPATVVHGQWHTGVYRISATRLHRFHYNWPSTTALVTYQDTDRSNPPDPAMFIGGNSWAPSTEVPNSILRGFQIYTSELTDQQVTDELADPGSAVTPWYLNLNPTVADISDKSGSGNNPVWVDHSNPPEDWEG